MGSIEGQLIAAEKVFRFRHASICHPKGSPAWVAQVEKEMVVNRWTGGLLTREGATWMGYWDQHVRNTGRGR